ncbi:MAG: hypothetical protein JO180_06770 [Gemmatirosa sp.]|nr:hypothetical protein [Gemmatirosa sp.]
MHRRTIALLAAAVASAATGCAHRAPPNAPAPSAGTAASTGTSAAYASIVTVPAGHAVGDSALFGAAIVGVDVATGRAVFELRRDAYVLLVGVTPGVSIDRLFDGVRRTSRGLVKEGRHVVTVAVPDGIAAPTGPLAGSPEYDRCVATRTRQYYHEPYVPPRVERDAQGRTVTVPPSPSEIGLARADARAKAESQAERECMSMPGAALRQSTRAFAGSHVLLLVSDAPIDDGTYGQRVARLAVNAPTVEQSVDAVAEGLMVGRTSRWAGHYVPWKPRPSP